MTDASLTGAALTGFLSGLSLIVAIGAQNAFVLRLGILRSHVLPVVLLCALSDAVLVTVGVFASAGVSAIVPGVLPMMRWGGAAFLLAYGARSALAAWRGGTHLDAAAQGARPLAATLVTALALTWLNPHVYLDTVVLLGAISAQFPDAQGAFALGAILASFSFFFALGYGARFLAPIFARPLSWRILDVAIALVMWTIAIRLVQGA
nr:LysE/ArgO family amino acid transporter [uncultured Celeribacter sp.]